MSTDDPFVAQREARARAIAIEKNGGMEKPALPSTSPVMTGGKFDDDHKKAILSALVNNHFLPAAAALAGIRVEALYEWIARGNRDRNADLDTPYAEFAMKVEQAIATGEHNALKTVNKAAERGNVQAALAILERRHGDRGWRKTDKVEHSGDPSSPVVVQLTWPGQPTAVPEAPQPEQPELPQVVDKGGDDDVVDAEVVDDDVTRDASTG